MNQNQKQVQEDNNSRDNDDSTKRANSSQQKKIYHSKEEHHCNNKDVVALKKRRKVCYFTQIKVEHIDFKDVELLKFVTDRGRFYQDVWLEHLQNGNVHLRQPIKERARHMALLPFVKTK